jgi:membrane-associated phospholipid phosphatase
MLSRAGTVGPFAGDTLDAREPGFDKPASLTRWEDAPRLAACASELLEGLVFTTQSASKQATLEHANLHASPIRRRSLITLRAPSKAIFKKQLDLVAAYADLRADRAAEIVAQMAPPFAFWASVVGILPHRHKKTLQLLELAFSLAVHVEMRFKHVFASTRPVEMSPQIQPMIPTPGHGSWPSGHATEAFIVATVLEALLDAADPTATNGSACREQLQRLAARIAVNRTVAGVHFPVDSAVGRLLGTALGEFFIARSTGASVRHRGFDGRLFVGAHNEAKDFSLHDAIDSGAGSVSGPAVALAAGPMLAWLWQGAVQEWQ